MGWKKELARQIKTARKSVNLTQSELASRLHVSRQMVSRYETARDVPVVDILALLSQTLEVEFNVRGFRITFERTTAKLRSIPKQLRLDFEKPREFRRAVVNITPREGRILITAEIPA